MEGLVLKWIRENKTVEEVFGEIFSEAYVIEKAIGLINQGKAMHIVFSFDPEDVFREKDLEYWALNNGFVKES